MPSATRADEIALQRDAVAVAAGHLQDRLDAVCEQEMRRRDAREMRLGAGAVGDVDRGGDALERQRAGDEGGGIGRDRRRQLGGDDEASAVEFALERARVA